MTLKLYDSLECMKCCSPELLAGNVDCSQRRTGQGGKRYIVNSHDRNIFRNLDPGFFKSAHRAHGYKITSAKDHCGYLVKWADRDPQHRAQFFSSDAINNTGNYFSIPTVTTTIAGVWTVQTAPGNLGRNTYTGPGWWNMDFSVLKDPILRKR